MYRLLFMIIMLFTISAVSAADSTAVAKDTTEAKTENGAEKKSKKSKKPKFEDVIEDYETVEGLFTLYHHPKEDKVYMEVRQDQFGPTFLCNITRESGDGYMFDSGAMLDEFPFQLKLVNDKVQFVRENPRFRASPDAALNRALERNVSRSLWGSVKIASEPHPDRGSILLEVSDIFLNDENGVGYQSGRRKMSYSFDKGDSYFSGLKSFPFNTEIEVTLHFTSGKPQPFFTLTDSRSMLHSYHYSLSELPESDYQPRAADDRIGHFVTLYQDYTSLLEDSPYRRYITRWNLQKAEPRFELSPPQKPIVYWLENTIPVEYRAAVQEGVLLWNKAFEKIGFKDAVQVRQMPDDAGWDPADVRYSTIRWIVQPGSGYAVGPSRANPYTGEIYDADIRVSADFVRFFSTEFGEFVTPLSWADTKTDRLWPGMRGSDESLENPALQSCRFADGFSRQMAFGWNVLTARGLAGKHPQDMEKFIHNGIVDLIVHEVGHTLGLRHNFKASAAIDFDKLSDSKFTAANGISGSVMDYNPVNLSAKGKDPAACFQTTLGQYDYWAIEYAYRELPPGSKKSETEMLEEIAARVTEPQLQYGTDEDALGFSSRGMDPTCSQFDLGSDPLRYFEQRTALARELWASIPEKFEEEGETYNKYRKVFGQGISEYAIAAALAPRYVGGVYSRRDHIGDDHSRPPFEVVPAEKQRKALNFIIEHYFSPESFSFDPGLLLRLAPERGWDFENTIFRIQRQDYPIHGIVQLLQSSAMFRLFDPLVLLRIQDNEIRTTEKQPFTMPELFETVRKAVWQELPAGENISSFRRELQRMHLFVLNTIVVNSPQALPHDAISLARADLNTIRDQIRNYLAKGNADRYSRAHLQEVEAKISASLNAQILGSY
ncbi:MAG: zinc-dependent metalloprotease [Calditrichia bacterium]